MKQENFFATLCISILALLCLAACASGRKVVAGGDGPEDSPGEPRTLLLVGKVYRDNASQLPRFAISRMWTEAGDMGELLTTDEAEDDLTFCLVSGTGTSTCRIANPLRLYLETADANGAWERSTLEQDSGTVFVRLPFTSYDESSTYTLMGKQSNKTFYKQIIEL